MGKHFEVTVKPTIPASKQHLGAFAQNDLVFDWTAFNMPKGSSRLLNTAALIRGTNGAAQTNSALDMEIFFAKSIDGVAPPSLGTVNSAVTGTGWYNHLIGMQFFDGNTNNMLSSAGLVYMSMYQAGNRGGGPDVVLTGEPDSGVNVGFDTVYVAGVQPSSSATFNFSTAVETTAAEDVSALSTAIIGGTSALDNGSGSTADCLKKFAVGDILHAEDDVILGEIASLTATTITFRHDGVNQFHGNGQLLYEVPDNFAAWQVQNGAGAAGDLADGDEIYNVHPITLKFSFDH